MTQLAYIGDELVGAIACRLELTPLKSGARLYLMTVGVYAPHRNGAIGTRLLRHALNEGSTDTFIEDAYLHVHTPNTEAIAFYKRFGFVEDGVVQNYYKRLDPPDAAVLKLRRANGKHKHRRWVHLEREGDGVILVWAQHEDGSEQWQWKTFGSVPPKRRTVTGVREHMLPPDHANAHALGLAVETMEGGDVLLVAESAEQRATWLSALREIIVAQALRKMPQRQPGDRGQGKKREHGDHIGQHQQWQEEYESFRPLSMGPAKLVAACCRGA